jgi:hypothetical protein
MRYRLARLPQRRHDPLPRIDPPSLHENDMRADDVLPDTANQGDFNGVTIRKGTIAAFLANAAAWSDPASSAAQRATAEAHIAEALPALRAVGLFDVLEVRDPALRAWLAQSPPNRL